MARCFKAVGKGEVGLPVNAARFGLELTFGAVYAYPVYACALKQCLDCLYPIKLRYQHIRGSAVTVDDRTRNEVANSSRKLTFSCHNYCDR